MKSFILKEVFQNQWNYERVPMRIMIKILSALFDGWWKSGADGIVIDVFELIGMKYTYNYLFDCINSSPQY